jgi:CDP-diacylglycerol--serine O-phosphatidyltransferase
LRLARFNIQKSSIESHHFKGLPIPGAAIMIATAILFTNSMGGLHENLQILIVITIYLLSFLMVSTIDYWSLKEFELFKQKPFNVLVAFILVFVVVAYKPALMLFLFASLYVFSGPALKFYYLLRRGARRPGPALVSSSESSEESLENQ